MTPRRPTRGPWKPRPNEEAQKAPPVQLRSHKLSREEAAVLNHRNISLQAAWLFTDKDIGRIFKLKRADFQTQQRFQNEVWKWKHRMNRDMVRITMSLLCQDWLERDSDPPGVPVNQLKKYLVAHVSGEAKYKRLERALKTLRRAGFVEGYTERPTHTTKKHEVRATKDGVKEHLKYLARCRNECEVFDHDLWWIRMGEHVQRLGPTPDLFEGDSDG